MTADRSPTISQNFYGNIVSRLRRSIALLTIAALLAAAGCSDGGRSGASAAAGDDNLQAGFEADGGSLVLSSSSAQVAAKFDEFIFLRVEVNGQPGEFILDSGAEAFFVSKDFAARTGLAPRGEVTVTTIAGTDAVPSYRFDTFAVGNVIGADIDAAAVDLDGIDGIIGLPFFRAVLVVIDYANQQLFFEDPSQRDLTDVQAEQGGEIVAAPNFILNDLTVNGNHVGPVRLDSGSNGGVRLDSSRGGHLLANAGQTAEVFSSTTNGTVSGTAFIAREVSFAGFLTPFQYVIVQEIPLPIGLVGNLVLQQFYVAMDLSRNKVLLRRDRHLRYNLIDRGPFRVPRLAD